MGKHIAFCLIGLLIALSSSGCNTGPAEPPVFDGTRAFGYLVDQVELEPRVPGTPASAAARDLFYRHFSNLGLSVDSQKFDYFDPYSQTEFTMTNVIASYRSENTGAGPAILLVAHYDCRPRTDYAVDTTLKNHPIDGANDGASGVAVLMELANLFAQTPAPCNVDLLLVDGEDWGRVGDLKNYMLGSREFARSGIRGKYRFGLVLDMIGDADQQIYREVFSDQYHDDLNDLVWGTAQKLGITTFIDSAKYHIQDDHLPLNVGGVPTIDIIDFDYKFWHTEFDTPDKCSAKSLENVGRVLTDIIYKSWTWQKN